MYCFRSLRNSQDGVCHDSDRGWTRAGDEVVACSDASGLDCINWWGPVWWQYVVGCGTNVRGTQCRVRSAYHLGDRSLELLPSGIVCNPAINDSVQGY